MDASPASLKLPTVEGAALSVRRWTRGFAAVVIATELFAGLFLLARRAAGAFTRPLDLFVLVAVAAVLCLVSFCVRHPLFSSGRRNDAWGRQLVFWLPTLAMLLVGWSLSIPGTRPAALLVFWCALVVGEAAILWRQRIRRSGKRISAPRRPQDLQAARLVDEEGALGSQVSQHLKRSRDAAGLERIEGLLRADFQPSERQTALHVAFCPPLAQVPHIETEQLAGPAVRIKAAQVQTFGVRFDLRLPRPAANDESVVIQLVASELPAEQGRAVT